MFYNTEMLTKRGPLARVWMASHLSTKLTKSNLLQTSIPESINSILGQELLPMALRLSGQLLFGVARIYSRKTKYLLDDCNETLVRVKRAFRPGALDMEEGERSRDAVTLRAEAGGLDDILNYDAGNYWDMDFNAPVAGTSNLRAQNAKNVSALADITLPEHHFGDYGDESLGFDYGDAGPIGGDDFDLGLDDLLDLGLEVEMGLGEDGKGKKRAREEDEESVERGRDAMGSEAHASARGSSAGPDLDAFEKEGEGRDSIAPVEMEVDMGGMGDMGFDFGDFGGGGEKDRMDQRETTPKAAEQESLGLTPKTAAEVAQKERSPKKPKLRKQVVDRVTELDWEAKGKQEKENLFIEPNYLPRSRLHLRLLELAAHPTLGLPQPTDSTNFFLAPPSGIAPELAELYKFPTRRSRLTKRVDDPATPEKGVRAEEAQQEEGGWDVHQEFGGGGEEDMGGYGYEPMGEDAGFQFDLGGEEDEVVVKGSQSLKKERRKREVEERDEEEGEGRVSEGPLAVFDDARTVAATQTQTQTQTQSLGADEEDAVVETKWSKNTVKALGVLRQELDPEDEGFKMEFSAVADKATKKVAAAFFFELLVLSTRGCVNVQQREAYGEIEVGAETALWEGVEVEA